MEKIFKKRTTSTKKQTELKKIVITGPESVGKTTLTKYLANHYNTIWLPEYAREYIEKLNKPYTYNDVVEIAKKQIILEKKYQRKAKKILFIDTGLIVTKIWFKEVYNEYPIWINEAIKNQKTNLFLLCNYDIPWVNDGIRENGSNEKRKYLFNEYKKEIEKNGYNYKIIYNLDEQRFKNAIKITDKEIF